MKRVTTLIPSGLIALSLVVVLGVAAHARSILIVNDRAVLTPDHSTAIVVGQVLCDDGQEFEVSVTVIQNQKQSGVSGSGFLPLQGCIGGGLATPFAVQVTVSSPAGGTFKKGQASFALEIIGDAGPLFAGGRLRLGS